LLPPLPKQRYSAATAPLADILFVVIYILNFTGHSRQLKTPRKKYEVLERRLNLALTSISIASATSVLMARNDLKRNLKCLILI
jgi:hypothetical protein